MRYVLPLMIVLFAGCSKPPPKTVATKPELGMYLWDFQLLCGFDSSDSKTVTNEQGETLTMTYTPTDINRNPRIGDCVGTFTFVNNKLTQIVR